MTSENINKQPMVSVVIPAYNHECWISETLASVLNQSLKDLEVIVIDDGSTDKTAALVAACDDDRVKLIIQENRGTSATINRGLELSRGRYIAILNSDDLFCPDRLAHFTAFLEDHSEYMMAFSRVQLINPEGQVLVEEEPECQWLRQAELDYQEGGDLLLSLLRDNFLCTSSNFFFRRRLLTEIGAFRDLRYVNDLDFLLRALARFKAYYCDRELLAYRQHPGNTLKERERELNKQVDFLLEVSLVLAAALEDGRLVRQWDFSVLVGLLVNYYRLNLEAVLFALLYFHHHRQGFKSVQEIAGSELAVLLESGRRCLEEREFAEKLAAQVQEQYQYIGTLQEALNFHLTEIETLQKIKRELEQQHQDLVAGLWQRDQEIARIEHLQRETWQSRESYRQQYEMAINSRRYRLFEALSGLRHRQQVGRQLKELLRIMLPSAWLENIRSWRFRIKSPKVVSRIFKDELRQKLGSCAVRLFDSHRYCQQKYESQPLLTLVVDCDKRADPLTAVYASLKEQTWTDFAVVFLVADGDREQEQELVSAITRDKFENWQVLVTELNTSVGLFNQALATATGKYIVSLSSVDKLVPTFLEECLLLLEASPPHFFLQSDNHLKGRAEGSAAPVEAPAALDEDGCRVLMFSRQAGIEVEGYDETLSTNYAAWEFYLKRLKSGGVGCGLEARLDDGLARELDPGSDLVAGDLSDRDRIVSRHRDDFIKYEPRLRRLVRQYWRVSQPLTNLLPEPERVKKPVLWLDLTEVSTLPEAFFIRLMARVEDPACPLVITIDKRWQSFFRYNRKTGFRVYQPECYHLQGCKDYFYDYFKAVYQLRQIGVDDIMQIPESGFSRPHDRLRILYVAPWLITGGADTMTVDWFRRLKSDWSEKYFATTIRREHNWLPKIVETARSIYNLPESGCRDQAAMTDFLIELIALHQIDILHIMNSEIAFNALPELKEKFPALKVVAQFHCFDYTPEGKPVGYALDVPRRYDRFIDAYNLEYFRLGEDIRQVYPYLESAKFKVIHGRVDSVFYNPVGRLLRPGIAAYRRDVGLNLLFIGRLDRQKQPLRLLAIAAALRAQGILFTMHVIGDANLESQKKAFLEALREENLADQVCYYGEQPLESMVDWYQIADVLLLTSDWEGVPMVLYQAMAMAVVPVVADVGGCAELVSPDCGYLIAERDNPEAYLEAIKELQDDEHRQKLARAARLRMREDFSLAELDREYRTFYEDIMK